MHRLNVDIDDDLNYWLGKLPGTKSTHVRIALVEYVKSKHKDLVVDVASSQSERKEVDYNEE